MALKTIVYNQGKWRLFDRTASGIDLVTDIASGAIKFMLMKGGTGSYVTAVNQDSDFVGDIAATYEIVATNYTGGYNGAGRHALTTTGLWAVDDTNDLAKFTCGDAAVWTALGGAVNDTIGGAVLFKQITNDASSPLIAFYELATAVPTNGGNFTLTIAAGGLITGTHIAT